jgi:hypothetical protein
MHPDPGVWSNRVLPASVREIGGHRGVDHGLARLGQKDKPWHARTRPEPRKDCSSRAAFTTHRRLAVDAAESVADAGGTVDAGDKAGAESWRVARGPRFGALLRVS